MNQLEDRHKAAQEQSEVCASRNYGTEEQKKQTET